MCLLLILPPSTEPLSPKLQRTVLCYAGGGQEQPLLHTHEQTVLSAQSAQRQLQQGNSNIACEEFVSIASKSRGFIAK